MKRFLFAFSFLLASSPAMATPTQAQLYGQLGVVFQHRGFTGLELQLILNNLYGEPRFYDTAAHLLADASQQDGTEGYALDTHASYRYVNGVWVAGVSSGGALNVSGNFSVNTNKFTVTASNGNTLSAGTDTVTGALFANGGVDRSTAAALTLGGTNATSVNTTPVLNANGGIDLSSAGALAIGAAVATSVTITPATTVTGLISANGGLDRSSAAALAIGATNATSTNIGATGTAVAITSAGAVTVPSTLGVTGLTTATGGLICPSNTDTATGSVLTTATSCGLFVANASTDAVTTWTLPAASTKASYCFSQGASSLGSNREVDVATPSGSDLIIGTTTAAGGTGIATTAGASHGIKNTHATAVRGNMVCLKADGTNTWYMTSLSGTWAAF